MCIRDRASAVSSRFETAMDNRSDPSVQRRNELTSSARDETDICNGGAATDSAYMERDAATQEQARIYVAVDVDGGLTWPLTGAQQYVAQRNATCIENAQSVDRNVTQDELPPGSTHEIHAPIKTPRAVAQCVTPLEPADLVVHTSPERKAKADLCLALGRCVYD